MQNASIYKTAAELGIKQWEHDGLVALVGPLSRGELALDMHHYNSECGTVHCIGGWVRARGRDAVFSNTLLPLYYPGFDGHPGWDATAPQASRAIVNFLTLGEPRWDDVMREADAAEETLRAIKAAIDAMDLDGFDADDSGSVEHQVKEAL